jgi:2,4-dienoyl-CoA reductase (NADPH2)
VTLARAVEAAGATIINTGIGWHEARVPTIATSVPRRAFAWVTKKLMGEVGIPLITSNRINTPEVAEAVLAEGCADMVSMARPFLADAHFVAKARRGEAARIAPCIACNQACLDHTFEGKVSTCLVNPRAGFETELVYAPVTVVKRVAVVGAGPAGMTAAIVAAERGHRDAVREGRPHRRAAQHGAGHPGQGGVPRPCRLVRGGVVGDRRRGAAGDGCDARALAGFDEVIVATGVLPRDPAIPGQDGPNVLSYVDVLRGGAPVGARVAIVGAGGIGFDVAEFLVHEATARPSTRRCGGRMGRGGPCANIAAGSRPRGRGRRRPARAVTLLQRKAEKPGRRLGKTTGGFTARASR